MKKQCLMMGALMLALASCTTEQNPSAGGGNGAATQSGEFAYLKADQSRIVTRATAGATFSENVYTKEKQPSSYEAVEWDANWQQGDLKGISSFKISDGNPASEFKMDGMPEGVDHVDIYIEKRGGVKLNLPQGRNAFNIYVLEGASLSFVNTVVDQGWTIKCWGEMEMPYNQWWEDAVEIKEGAKVYYYANNDKKLEFGRFSFSDNNNETEFVTFVPVEFNGETTIAGGTLTCANSAKFNGKVYINNHETNINLSECTWFNGGIEFNGNSAPMNITSHYLIYFKNFTTQDGSKMDITLDNSVLVIDDYTDYEWADAGKNVLQENTVITGIGNSAVYFLGSVTAHMKNRGDIDMLRGSLAVLGAPENDYIPTIHVSTTNNTNATYGTDAPFKEAGVKVLNPDIVISAKDEYDCRSGYVFNEDDDIIEVMPPFDDSWNGGDDKFHKYSATGIAFIDDNTVAVCWHSNLHEGEDGGTLGEEQDGIFHDHGTNSGAGYPSVKDAQDWGGIIDIIKLDAYNPENGPLFSQTLLNKQFKYNYVKYDNGKLYLAATSKRGAELNVIDFAGSLPSADALNAESATASARVKLAGTSANCVELVNGNVATISGRSLGAVNWFAFTGDDDKRSTDYVEFSDYTFEIDKESGVAGYTDFGGKYLADDGTYIIALNNTESATLSFLDKSTGSVLGSFNTGLKISPNDGKNVLVAKNGKLYVCCGHNGLHVYNYSGTSVEENEFGYSDYSANAVAVDDNGYIYLATGAGVVTLDPEKKLENKQTFKPIRYEQYTGAGFNYPAGRQPEEGEIKESSNFVVLHNGKVYVAYGMYGLRIYDQNYLLTAQAEE